MRTSSRLRAWALSDPRLSSRARMRKKCCYCWKNLGSICSSLSPSPTHLSHTRDINPFENKLWEVYFHKEVCSFVHWSRHYCWLYFRLYLYTYMYICSCIVHLFVTIQYLLREKRKEAMRKMGMVSRCN